MDGEQMITGEEKQQVKVGYGVGDGFRARILVIKGEGVITFQKQNGHGGHT